MIKFVIDNIVIKTIFFKEKDFIEENFKTFERGQSFAMLANLCK